MRILLFANGVANDGTMVRRALEGAGSAHILCADGGALNALKFGLAPQTIIGDLDSLNATQVEEFRAAGAKILRFPTEKDETDLELALRWSVDKGANAIVIAGALGGRFDQTLANVHLLALADLQDIQIELVDGEQRIRLLRPGTHRIDGRSGDTVSLIPLGGKAGGISTSGLQYPLRDESLALGPARGISNVMLCDSASLDLGSGLLLVIHTCGRA
ncbi:MAG: thiamine diphosphokinase [Chloroflexota bacterium]|nr:thiamine diphosphokinase [Chloroflexota bacterium]